ncbi:hypothetical protein Y032_0034g2951 [Ancylostoma ceylanicum]|nr:hypothetical protein Y032_0034g2951 [Ancylostoma ceylanicum]
MIHRFGASSVSVRNCYDPRNKISGAYNPNITRDGPSSVIHGAPCFMTRSTFDQQMKAIRTSDAGADFGIQPSTLQRYLLIATKLYQTHDDIPLYVASGTMNRMYDRMRILSTSLAIAGFFILFYYCHYANVNRVMRDREAGYMMHS